MTTITRHKDRPGFNNQEQQEKEEEAHRRLRNYTKRVLKHAYLKAKKEASDNISRLISYWRFDVPGWIPNTSCPVFHKTKEDLELEQEMVDKKNYVMGHREGLNKTKIQIENEALARRYDDMPRPKQKPKKPHKENIRTNAEQIISQFRGLEIVDSMLKAFKQEEYNKVFDLALQYDLRHRENQRMEAHDKREKCKSSITEEHEKMARNWRRPHLDWLEIFDEIIEENKPASASKHAFEHCKEALKHLSGDLTYDDRSDAKHALLQAMKSLEIYPQGDIPEPKQLYDDCSCPNCSNTRNLTVVLQNILTEPSDMKEEEKEEIDNLFDCNSKTPSEQAVVTEERLMDFGKVDYCR